MNFLATYKSARDKRAALIESKKTQIEELKPAVEEYENLKSEIDFLQKENRQDEKFLINMNEMVLRNTGDPIDNGPLFNNEKTEEDSEQE
jgi:hypothetical protein